jgi:hypothetical protein
MTSFWQLVRYNFSSPYKRGLPPVDERTETLEAALRTIQDAIPKYLKKQMTAEEFALVVIGEADSGKVNKALEKGK